LSELLFCSSMWIGFFPRAALNLTRPRRSFDIVDATRIRARLAQRQYRNFVQEYLAAARPMESGAGDTRAKAKESQPQRGQSQGKPRSACGESQEKPRLAGSESQQEPMKANESQARREARRLSCAVFTLVDECLRLLTFDAPPPPIGAKWAAPRFWYSSRRCR
jgi:hypothetical protein